MNQELIALAGKENGSVFIGYPISIGIRPVADQQFTPYVECHYSGEIRLYQMPEAFELLDQLLGKFSVNIHCANTVCKVWIERVSGIWKIETN